MKTLIFFLVFMYSLNICYAADKPLRAFEYRVVRIVQNAKAAMILFNDEKIKAIKRLKSEDLNYAQYVKELPNGTYEVVFIWSRK